MKSNKSHPADRGTPPPTENRYYLLYELFNSITSALKPKKALNLIIDAAVRITGATNGSLILVDWEKRVLNIEVSRGFAKPIKGVKLKVGEGITGWVAEHGKALLISDVSDDLRYVPVNEKIKSELAVPLLLEDQLIGVLNVDSTRSNAFTTEDLDLLTLLSKQSAQVIQNGQLFDTANRKIEELSTLIKINKTIASSLDLDKTLRQIVERTARLMNSALCSIMLVSEDGDSLMLKAHHGGSSDYERRPNISIKQSDIGKVIRKRRSLIVYDIAKELDAAFAAIARQEGLRSLLSVPLVVRNRAIGLINIYKSRKYRFSDEEKRLLKTFADLCAIAIENAQLYEKMLTLEEQTRHAERLTSVGELAVSIAHEIRNPLTIVKMIFESGDRLNVRDREVISEELSRMNEIITRLLDFTRPKEAVREACRVQKSLQNALFLLAREFVRKNIQINTQFADSLPKILADPVQLQQVFLNLLLNASEAMPGGGKIDISVQPAGEHLKISISDNGIGLPESVQKKLFVPFTTTKMTGLGLGLSIVKRIIDAHGGEIRMNSATDTGTRVTIRLPVESSFS